MIYIKGVLKSIRPAFIAFTLAIIVSGIIIALSGYNPIEAFSAILIGAFSNKSAIARTLSQATPLIFTGLAFTFAKKASLVNLGVEGQLYVGALFSILIGLLKLPIPPFFHIILAICTGAFAGGLFGGLVGFLKVKFGSNEVISTIMLNSIAILVINYLLSYQIKAEGSLIPQTEKLDSNLMLMKIIPKTQLTIGFIIAILACIATKYFIDNTKLGYEIKVTGFNKSAAVVAGINVGFITIVSMFISGAIGGFTGAVHVLGVDGRLIAGFSPGFGFSGIAVAALASENIIGIIFSGIIFGALLSGTMMLDLTTDIPLAFADLIQSLVIIFVTAPLLVNEIFRFNKTKKEV